MTELSEPVPGATGRPGPKDTEEARSARNRVVRGYGRFYAPIAVCMVVLMFFPLYDPVVVNEEYGTTFTSVYGTVFDMASTLPGGAAAIGLLLFAGLIIMLVIAATRSAGIALLVGMGSVSALMTILVITKPATGTPTPSISHAGAAGVALMIVTVVLAVAQIAQLAVLRQRDRRTGH